MPYYKPWVTGLGEEHSKAMDHMSYVKEGLTQIAIEGSSIHKNHNSMDSLPCCFNEAKRVISVRNGEGLFKLIDTDKNEILSSSEITCFMKKNPKLASDIDKIKNGTHGEDWSNILAFLDEDSDGVVDEDELKTYLHNHLERNLVKQLFSDIDTNCDRTISTEELQRFTKNNPGFKEVLLLSHHTHLVRYWSLFFSLVRTGSANVCSKAQFIQLWAATGLSTYHVNEYDEGLPSKLTATGTGYQQVLDNQQLQLQKNEVSWDTYKLLLRRVNNLQCSAINSSDRLLASVGICEELPEVLEKAGRKQIEYQQMSHRKFLLLSLEPVKTSVRTVLRRPSTAPSRHHSKNIVRTRSGTSCGNIIS